MSLDGKVSDQPDRVGRSWVFTVKTRDVDGTSATGSVQVAGRERVPPEVGDRIRVDVKMRRLDESDMFDRLLFRRGISMRARQVGGLDVISHTGNPAMAAANHLRDRLRTAAVDALDRADAGLLLGMTIGDEDLIPDATIEEFRASGLSHLTAVSGANVAIVVSAVILLFRALGRSRSTQIVAALVALVLFVLVTRWEPSVLRATVTTTIALGSFFFGRRQIGLHSLGIAFLVLMLIDPNLLWSVGAQLSFAATGAILLWARPLADILRSRWRLPKPVAEAAGLALSAQAGVWPLIALHFDVVSLWSVPANVAAFPLVAPITIAGFAAGSAALVWLPAGAAVATLAGPPIDWIAWIAHRFSELPGSTLPIYRAGWVTLLSAYLLTAMVVAWIMSRRRVALVILALLVLIGSAPQMIAAAASPSDAMRITFLDVGQGDAALIESPEGTRILIDGGPDPGLVASLLSRRGISRVDVVVFSHAHTDHIAGLDEVLDSFDVRQVIHPGTGELPASVRSIPPVVDGAAFMAGDLRLEILSPTSDLVEAADSEGADGESGAINDASVVLRVEFGEGCALFTGDVEEGAQADLIDRHPDLACDVMKAPHHGSARLLPEFVQAVHPRVVPISVGQNRFGHPTASAMRAFSRVGAHILRTDRSGDVVIHLGRDGSVEMP